MKLTNRIRINDLALELNEILIIADPHIGYEEYLNKEGLLVPRFQFERLLNKLSKIIKNRRFEKIIVNGDLKHEFGKISQQEWKDTLKFLDFLCKFSKKIILIKGNHDTILGPIAKKRNIEIVDYFKFKDTLICHGDKIIDNDNFKKLKTIIIGHEHPAISLREGMRTEKFKCWLVGKYKRKNLIVMPSLNLVVEGTDILKEKLLSPYLQQDLRNFEVFIVSDKIYKFGKLKNLKI